MVWRSVTLWGGGWKNYMIWWQDSLLLKNTWVKANLAWRFLFLLLFLTNLHSYRFIGNYIIYLAKTDHYFVRVRLILFWMTQFGVFAKKETNETWVIATIAHLLQLSLLSRPYAIDSNVSTRLQEISNLFIRKIKKIWKKLWNYPSNWLWTWHCLPIRLAGFV